MKYTEIEYNTLTELVIKSAIEVHTQLGPAQLVNYLKVSSKNLGLLINFNEDLLKNGVRRRINGDLNN